MILCGLTISFQNDAEFVQKDLTLLKKSLSLAFPMLIEYSKWVKIS